MNIVKAAATVGGMTALSRLTGFARDLMIAAFLGAGMLADAFFVAFKLANLLRRLFAEGAFNAGFVPLFARTLEGEGEAEARRFAEEALAVMTTILLVVVLLAELMMPWLVRVLASGFEPVGERFVTAVELSRITFPYLMMISLAALFSGILNSIGRFAAAAFAPVLLNIVLIAALLLGSLAGDRPAHALAWGVALAGLLQLAWVIVAARRNGMGLRLRLPRFTPRIKKLFALILPGAVGAGVYQINLIVDTWFASHLPVGAISYLFYADRLNQLPLGIVGIAIGTALLPMLSRQLRAGNLDDAGRTMNRALEMALLLALPAAVALFAIALPIVSTLFERGAFDAADSAATAAALMAFSIGLPAYVLIKVLAPAFFAREDTVTPVRIAAICLGLNVALILVFIGPFAHVGIALATALSNWVNAGLLAFVLLRRGQLVIDPQLRRRALGIVLAALVMVVLLKLIETAMAGHSAVLSLAAMVAGGGAGYLVAVQLLGGGDIRQFARLLSRRA